MTENLGSKPQYPIIPISIGRGMSSMDYRLSTIDYRLLTIDYGLPVQKKDGPLQNRLSDEF